MPQNRANIKVVVAAGVPIVDAIKAALPMTSAAFAAKYDFPPPHVSACINGHRLHERVRAALAEELGVAREWLDEQLDSVMRERQGQQVEV